MCATDKMNVTRIMNMWKNQNQEYIFMRKLERAKKLGVHIPSGYCLWYQENMDNMRGLPNEQRWMIWMNLDAETKSKYGVKHIISTLDI